jgi:hypothetical protein
VESEDVDEEVDKDTAFVGVRQKFLSSITTGGRRA